MAIYEAPIEDKTLYVCVNNVGRSQMAERFHNLWLPDNADSAGIGVDEPGSYVADWKGGAEVICQAMDELDLDIKKNSRTQYDPDIARKYARTVFLLEFDQIPNYILDLDDDRIIYWPFEDPRDVPIEKVREVRDYIQDSVSRLVSSIVNTELVQP